MKGIVFTEFIDMVDASFSPEILEEIIEAADVPSGAAYSTVGTYDHHELVQLVSHLSQKTGIAIPDLIVAFGKYLFERFSKLNPPFFKGIESSFEFLRRIDNFIHIEVQKLYPDAELPRFEYEEPGPGKLIMVYHSSRPFGDLARGLILGCIEHYQEAIDLQCENLSTESETCVRFILTKEE